MKILKILIFLFLVTNFSELRSDEINDVLKNKILKNIRCLICQGLSVYDSESEFASSIKLIVDKKINEGAKEDSIYSFLIEKYGDWIVYEPQLNKNTYILWLLPLLLFLLGGAIIVKKIQKKMNKNINIKFFSAVIFVLFSFSVNAEENVSEHQYNFYTGNFDFSDNKQKAILFGLQHQNENLERNTFLGNASPITGGFITENSAAYVYTGVEWNYAIGNKIKFTPSFAPGIYHEGDGKDLGHALEFKTEMQLYYTLSDSTNLGMSYNHISNASLGDKNPGANSYMFNLLKNF